MNFVCTMILPIGDSLYLRQNMLLITVIKQLLLLAFTLYFADR